MIAYSNRKSKPETKTTNNHNHHTLLSLPPYAIIYSISIVATMSSETNNNKPLHLPPVVERIEKGEKMPVCVLMVGMVREEGRVKRSVV
jgi:hypothetical protein